MRSKRGECISRSSKTEFPTFYFRTCAFEAAAYYVLAVITQTKVLPLKKIKNRNENKSWPRFDDDTFGVFCLRNSALVSVKRFWLDRVDVICPLNASTWCAYDTYSLPEAINASNGATRSHSHSQTHW